MDINPQQGRAGRRSIEVHWIEGKEVGKVKFKKTVELIGHNFPILVYEYTIWLTPHHIQPQE